MDDVREHQASKDVSSERPPADEEIRKMLLDLKLIPTKWQQSLLHKRWLPVAMFAPIACLFLIGLVDDAYYYLSLDAIYVSFALFMTVLVFMLQRFLKQTPLALRRLWRNRVISPSTSTGEADSASTVVDSLRRYEAGLASPWRYVLMGVVLLIADYFLVNHIRENLSLATFPDATFTLFLVFKWVVFPDLWLWVILTAGWPALVTVSFIRRLPQELDLRVIPSHPDQCGGLKPIGDLCLRLALIALIASVVLAYWGSIGRALRAAGVLPQLSEEVEGAVDEVLPETLHGFAFLFDFTRDGQPITRNFANFGTVAGIVLGGWSFFYPVLGIHKLMKDRKAEFALALADVASEFDMELEQSIRAKDGGQIKEAHSKLEALQHPYSLLQNYPLWPIGRRNFVVGFVAPELLSFAGLILNVDPELVDSALGWIRQLLLAPPS